MTDWTVNIDVETDVDLGPGTAEWLEGLADRLAGTGTAVSGHGSRIGGTLTVIDKPDCMSAAQEAINVFLHATLGGIVVAIEAITIEEADRRLDEPTIPELVGASEAADLLGISRQRVHQLHTGNQAFPEPVVEVRMGPLWTRASVEAFARSWTRTPGRPARALPTKSIPPGKRSAAKHEGQIAAHGTKGKMTGRRSGSTVRGSSA